MWKPGSSSKKSDKSSATCLKKRKRGGNNAASSRVKKKGIFMPTSQFYRLIQSAGTGRSRLEQFVEKSAALKKKTVVKIDGEGKKKSSMG